MLSRQVLLDASHACYAIIAADYIEQELDYHFGAGEEISDTVERLPDSVSLPIIMRYIGRVEGTWKETISMVFHHMELDTEDQQTRALYLLFWGCMGQGICLLDDFNAQFKKAQATLGFLNGVAGAYAPVHIETGSCEWYDEAVDRIGVTTDATCRYLTFSTHEPDNDMPHPLLRGRPQRILQTPYIRPTRFIDFERPEKPCKP